jgi:ABC-2 type transport system permease protein
MGLSSLRGLWKLTWLEVKIFVREPLGVIGSVIVPVVVFVVLGRLLGGGSGASNQSEWVRDFVGVDLPVFAAILIVLSAVLSLVTIIAIYREGGILKRLRATPLQPSAILGAHVLVKLLFTIVTAAMLMLAGRQYVPAGLHVPVLPFGVALIVSTFSVLSLGFVIASLVPTARFAQPIGTLILYPMVGLCGLFVPVDALPPALQAVSHVVPLTYATSLMRGVLLGDPLSAHLTDIAVLLAVFGACTAVSARVFRWE